MLQNTLTRTWFLSKGCRQVPTDIIGGKILWAHPDGYFLNAKGRKVQHVYSPCCRAKQTKRGYQPPTMRHFGTKPCHHLMARAFYGERPTYTDRNGKPYVGIVHHLIPDPLDYKPANLLCWLTREQHTEADRRQRLLRRELGDTHRLGYLKLQRLQDLRQTSPEDFESELNKLIEKNNA